MPSRTLIKLKPKTHKKNVKGKNAKPRKNSRLRASKKTSPKRANLKKTTLKSRKYLSKTSHKPNSQDVFLLMAIRSFDVYNEMLKNYLKLFSNSYYAKNQALAA